MGCGSSKSAVAVISYNNDDNTPAIKSESVENFLAKSPVQKEIDVTPNNNHIDVERHSPTPDVNNSLVKVKNAFVEEVCENDDIRSSNPRLNGNLSSVHSIQSNSSSKLRINSRDKSANSTGSKDSGVYDERMNSGQSEHSSYSARSERSGTGSGNSVRRQYGAEDATLVNRKPPSGSSKSSARRKLLRIEDDSLSDSQLNTPDEITEELNFNDSEKTLLPHVGQNMTLRPKSRFGNVAFDIVLDTPETGNAKKRPEKLVALSVKHKKEKKRKTKREIDMKMQEADARRKIQENEKLLKAKQFQHFAVHTTVEPFYPGDGELDEGKSGEELRRRLESEDEEGNAGKRNKGKSWMPNDIADDNNMINNRYNGDRTESSGSLRSNSNTVLTGNHTLVEPFSMDDEEELDNSKIIGRVNLETVVAC